MSEGNNRSGQGSEALAAAQETTLDRLDTTALTIGGEVFHVGELSLDQVIAVARLVSEAVVRMNEQQIKTLREVAARSGKPGAGGGQLSQNQANLTAALALLDRETIASIFGTILDRPQEWVRKNLKLRASIQIVAALLEHNDPEELKGAFFEVGKHLPPSLVSSLRGLASSPPTGSRNAKSGGTRSGGSGR
jgi:hypothetical protein